jgi:glycosyltransferase involved in cell wall biosynthesis
MGGVERFTECLWGRMASRGWDVTVITCNTDQAPHAEDVSGINVRRLPSWDVLSGRVPIPRPSILGLRVLLEVCTRPPGLVVSNTRFFPTSIIATVLAKLLRRPRMHIEHGSDFIKLDRPQLDAIIRGVDRLAGLWVLRTADACFGVSQAVADFACTLGARRCGVLYNGIDLTAPPEDGSPLRERLGVGPDELLVVYVGRLIEAKGVRDLLAARSLFGSDSRLHLAFAGAGPLAQELEALAARSPRLHMLGRLTQEEVRTLLAASDILCHPSAYPEGLPTVVLEGAAAGVAMVATPMGGTEEVVISGVTGLIVPASSPVALLDAIETLANDGTLRRTLASEARRRAETVFDWDLIAGVCEGEVTRLVCCGSADRADEPD